MRFAMLVLLIVAGAFVALAALDLPPIRSIAFAVGLSVYVVATIGFTEEMR